MIDENSKQPSEPSENNENSSEFDNLKEGTTTTDVTQDAQEALQRYESEKAEKRTREMPELGDEVTLKIEVQNALTPLFITVTHEMLMGRRDPATEELPKLDLTPYGGYQLGLSRRHAIIRLKNKKLEIYDLGSRNGTFIDGKRLVPHQPVPLLSGSLVRLGKIELKIEVHATK